MFLYDIINTHKIIIKSITYNNHNNFDTHYYYIRYINIVIHTFLYKSLYLCMMKKRGKIYMKICLFFI